MPALRKPEHGADLRVDRVVQRAVEGTALGPFPDQPDSDKIAIVRFRTSFSKESLAIERVTLELGPDQVWRVVGYVIR